VRKSAWLKSMAAGVAAGDWRGRNQWPYGIVAAKTKAESAYLRWRNSVMAMKIMLEIEEAAKMKKIK